MDFLSDETDSSKIALCIINPLKVRESNIKIIKLAQKYDFAAIVVTTNFPASVLEKLYSQNEIKTENLLFIDAISRYSMGTASVKSDERHINTNNPADLTGLSIAFSEMLKKTAGKKTIVLVDSISTMLIYLPPVKISQFVHLIASKIRQLDKSCAFLAVDGGLDPVLLSQISSFVDEIVKENE